MNHRYQKEKQEDPDAVKSFKSCCTFILCAALAFIVSCLDSAFSMICILYGCSFQGDQSPHKALY